MDNSNANSNYIKRLSRLTAENEALKIQLRAALDELDTLRNELEKTRAEQPQLFDNKKASRFTRYPMATVLFASMNGLYSLSEDAEQADKDADHFDALFLHFSAIAEKYNLVKVRALGDTFIYIGGIPQRSITAAARVAMAATEMMALFLEEEHKRPQKRLSFSIGIHTGTLMAAPTSNALFPYEIKGDALHVASRIATIDQQTTIRITGTSYEFLKELYECQYKGMVPVKYQHKMEFYNLIGIKHEFSDGKTALFPNKAFRTQYLLIQFADLQEKILDKLEKELPKHLYYHNVKHTVDVVTECELIGWMEGIDNHQMTILKTAALFHDVGHTIAYKNHEDHGCTIAREILPDFHYTKQDIDDICRIIMATKLPPNPQDILEQIICDADLDYLGRTDFIPVSNTLYEELKATNPDLSINDWNKQQVKFLTAHHYFTETGKRLREVNKNEQIERIKQLITE